MKTLSTRNKFDVETTEEKWIETIEQFVEATMLPKSKRKKQIRKIRTEAEKFDDIFFSCTDEIRRLEGKLAKLQSVKASLTPPTTRRSRKPAKH